MGDINNYLNNILNAEYGEEVRGSIHDAIKQCYLDGNSGSGASIIVDTALSTSSTNPVQNKVVANALNNKVDAVSGKGLSANDYTIDEKNKLAGIDEGANKTIVDTALSDNSTNPVQNKVITKALNNMSYNANTDGGFAGGESAVAATGAAVGMNSIAADGGFAGGKNSKARGFRNVDNQQLVYETGAAVGEGATAGRGFAGGFDAKVAEQTGSNGLLFIDAIQLGTGTNSEAKTLQVYDHQLLTDEGLIPSDRMRNSNGGFNAGMYSSAGFGGAVGSGAVTGKGFAGGFEAKAVDKNDKGIDAIQLGQGTNSEAKTFQVYGFKMMNSDGTIPSERLPVVSSTSIDDALSDTSTNPVQNKVITAKLNDKADMGTAYGGFKAGKDTDETAINVNAEAQLTGAAIGKNAVALSGGGAVGEGAYAGGEGGAVGKNAKVLGYGFAGGVNATVYGSNITDSDGNEIAIGGGAVGSGAEAGIGFSGGYNAKTARESGLAGAFQRIDAIQLGTGTNNNPRTLQIYDKQLLDADGIIPIERLGAITKEVESKWNKPQCIVSFPNGVGVNEAYIDFNTSYNLFFFVVENQFVLTLKRDSTADMPQTISTGKYEYISDDNNGFIKLSMAYDDAIGSYLLSKCEIASVDGSKVTPLKLTAIYGFYLE